MFYSQFHTPPIKERFGGVRGLAMFVAGVAVLGLSLILLPLMLLAGAVSFALLSTFGRRWIHRIHPRYQSHGQQNKAQTAPAGQSDTYVRFRDAGHFRPRPHQGRTFDHDPLE